MKNDLNGKREAQHRQERVSEHQYTSMEIM